MKRFHLLVSLLFLFYSTNTFAQLWSAQNNPVTGRDLNSAWAVDYYTCWMCGATSSNTLGYVIRTTNEGLTWTNVTGNIPASTIGLYTVCGISVSEAWVGASDGSVYHTTNGGTNWTFVTLPSPVTQFVDVIHFFNHNTGFIIGDPVANVWSYYWTTNAGTNWTAAGPAFTGSETGFNNSCYASDTGHIWFGVNAGKIYKGGLKTSFTFTNTVGVNTYGIAIPNGINGVAIMTSSSYSVLPNNITTNGGTSWASGGYTPLGVQYGIGCVPGTPNVWSCGAGSTGGIILYSTNYGVNWMQQVTLADIGFCITFANLSRGWVGCANGYIYKYGNPDEINNYNITLPIKFVLEQNFPNPFNPITNIKFSLPKESRVTLKVYDLLGNDVSTLLNGVIQKVGLNSYSFDGTNLSSGIYFYKIITDDFVDTKKMILLK